MPLEVVWSALLQFVVIYTEPLFEAASRMSTGAYVVLVTAFEPSGVLPVLLTL